VRHNLPHFRSIFLQILKIDFGRKIGHSSVNEQEGFKALNRQGVIGRHL
jgi:hypothetical protein